MVFSISRAVNGAAEWLTGGSLTGKLLNNPILTALLITSLSLAIVWAVYQSSLKGTGKKKMLRCALYLVFASFTVTFLHQYSVRQKIRKEFTNISTQSVFRSLKREGGYDFAEISPEPGTGEYSDGADGDGNTPNTPNTPSGDSGDTEVSDTPVNAAKMNDAHPASFTPQGINIPAYSHKELRVPSGMTVVKPAKA